MAAQCTRKRRRPVWCTMAVVFCSSTTMARAQTGTSMEQCKMLMSVADVDRDSFLSSAEYVFWLNQITSGQYAVASYDVLPDSLKILYATYATAPNGKIDINGARTGTATTSPMQGASLDALCVGAGQALAVASTGATAAGTVSPGTVTPSTIAPGTTTTTPTISIAACKTVLDASDADQNNMLNPSEYIALLNQRTGNQLAAATSLEQLPPSLQIAFNSLAEGNEIDIFGSNPTELTTEAQVATLLNICSAVDQAILSARTSPASTVTPSIAGATVIPGTVTPSTITPSSTMGPLTVNPSPQPLNSTQGTATPSTSTVSNGTVSPTLTNLPAPVGNITVANASTTIPLPSTAPLGNQTAPLQTTPFIDPTSLIVTIYSSFHLSGNQTANAFNNKMSFNRLPIEDAFQRFVETVTPGFLAALNGVTLSPTTTSNASVTIDPSTASPSGASQATLPITVTPSIPASMAVSGALTATVVPNVTSPPGTSTPLPKPNSTMATTAGPNTMPPTLLGSTMTPNATNLPVTATGAPVLLGSTAIPNATIVPTATSMSPAATSMPPVLDLTVPPSPITSTLLPGTSAATTQLPTTPQTTLSSTLRPQTAAPVQRMLRGYWRRIQELGTVLPATIAPSTAGVATSVVPGTANPGTIPASVAPATGAPTAVASTTALPGTVPSSSVVPSTIGSSTSAPGIATTATTVGPGTATPGLGTVSPGNTSVPGSGVPSTSTPGSIVPATVIPATAVPATATPGTTSSPGAAVTVSATAAPTTGSTMAGTALAASTSPGNSTVLPISTVPPGTPSTNAGLPGNVTTPALPSSVPGTIAPTANTTSVTSVPVAPADTTQPPLGQDSILLNSSSPRILLFEDSPCPAGVSAPYCLVAFAQYIVSVPDDSNRTLVYNTLVVQTQKAISTGELQAALVAVDPATDVTVLGPSEPVFGTLAATTPPATNLPTAAPSSEEAATYLGLPLGGFLGIVLVLVLMTCVASGCFGYVLYNLKTANDSAKQDGPTKDVSDNDDRFDDEENQKMGDLTNVVPAASQSFGAFQVYPDDGNRFSPNISNADDSETESEEEKPSDNTGQRRKDQDAEFGFEIGGPELPDEFKLDVEEAYSSGDESRERDAVDKSGFTKSHSPGKRAESDDDSYNEDTKDFGFNSNEPAANDFFAPEPSGFFGGGDKVAWGQAKASQTKATGDSFETDDESSGYSDDGEDDGVAQTREQKRDYNSDDVDSDSEQDDKGDGVAQSRDKKSEYASDSDEDDDQSEQDDKSGESEMESDDEETVDIRKQIVDLVRDAAPHELDNIDMMMEQFAGREGELLQTLKIMHAKKTEDEDDEESHKSDEESEDQESRFESGSSQESEYDHDSRVDESSKDGHSRSTRDKDGSFSGDDSFGGDDYSQDEDDRPQNQKSHNKQANNDEDYSDDDSDSYR